MSMMLRRLMQVSNGGAVPDGCEIGVFEVDEEAQTLTINHNLGASPKYAFVMAVINGAYNSQDDNSRLLFEGLGADPLDNVFDITRGVAHVFNAVDSFNNTGGGAYSASSTYTTYPASLTETTVTFATGRYYGAKFLPGKKYVYILVK